MRRRLLLKLRISSTTVLLYLLLKCLWKLTELQQCRAIRNSCLQWYSCLTFSESPSWLPECIPLTLFLVMLQLVTSLQPRKLCSWFLCVLRVCCINRHAFGLWPGFWVRLLPLTWSNCTVALYSSVCGMQYEAVSQWVCCERHCTFLISSSHCNKICCCIPSSVIWIVFCLYNVTVASWLQNWPENCINNNSELLQIIYLLWFFKAMKVARCHSRV